MSKWVIKTLGCCILIGACSFGGSDWNTSYESLSDNGKSCIAGWIYNYEIINETLLMVKESDFKTMEDMLVIKSGSTGQARYEFLAMIMLKNKGVVISSSSSFPKPIKVDLPKKDVTNWIADFDRLTTGDSLIITGETDGVSHVPCEFAMRRKGEIKTSLAVIGLSDANDYGRFFESIFRFKSKVDSGSIGESKVMRSPLPTQEYSAELTRSLKKDMFFEVASLKARSQ